MTTTVRPNSGIWRFILGALLAFGIALGLFYLLMRPPLGDFTIMTELMSLTALISIAASYGAYRLGWIQRSPSIRLTLMGGYVIASLLIFLNILVIARLMFASQHDLLLATVLLVFATGIAVSLGYFLSSAVTDRIQMLCKAAENIAAGHFNQRIPVEGRDEMTMLAATVNAMTIRLQEGEQKQRELDALRRDLIAWVSHDLRTPLTSIRALLEALADGVVEDPQTTKRYLRTAQQDILSLSSLIDDLFEMSQMDAGGLQLDIAPNSLSDLISDTIESFSALAKQQGITLGGSIQPGIDPVNMDARRIGRVLNNLVSNSLSHTTAGGQVNICASRQDDNHVLVEVEDNGEGIRPEDLPHVFERFYRSDKSRSRATGGAGLGLAIAHGIVEAHGGKIAVESTPGKGARFFFWMTG